MRTTLTVWLAAGSPLFCEGLKRALRKPRFSVERTGATLAEILDFSVPPPAIVIFGSAAEPDAAALVARLRGNSDHAGNTRFVLLFNEDRQPDLPIALRSLVDAILPTDIPGEALAHFLEIVALGHPVAVTRPECLAGGEPDNLCDPIPQTKSPAREGSGDETGLPPTCAGVALLRSLCDDYQISLSDRESEILQCLRRGLPNKTIARQLRISDSTVKVHVKSLLKKIRVQNRTQAAIWANETHLGALPAQESNAALPKVQSP